MSAIAKPMVHTTNTKGGIAEPINIELVKGFGKATKSAMGNSPAEYLITFEYNDGNPPLRWRYETEVARDTDFDALVALASTSL